MPKSHWTAHISTYSDPNDDVRYNEFTYPMNLSTIFGKLHRQEPPVLINDWSEICVMIKDSARRLNIGWKHADCELITADGVWSNLRKETWSVAVTSAKNISVRAECLRQSARTPSEPSETPRWRITPRPASGPRVASHIALRSLFHRFFSLCRSSILKKHSGILANCDHTSEWFHWVHTCIGIAMQLVTLQKSLLAFLLH